MRRATGAETLIVALLVVIVFQLSEVVSLLTRLADAFGT